MAQIRWQDSAPANIPIGAFQQQANLRKDAINSAIAPLLQTLDTVKQNNTQQAIDAVNKAQTVTDFRSQQNQDNINNVLGGLSGYDQTAVNAQRDQRINQLINREDVNTAYDDRPAMNAFAKSLVDGSTPEQQLANAGKLTNSNNVLKSLGLYQENQNTANDLKVKQEKNRIDALKVTNDAINDRNKNLTDIAVAGMRNKGTGSNGNDPIISNNNGGEASITDASTANNGNVNINNIISQITGTGGATPSTSLDNVNSAYGSLTSKYATKNVPQQLINAVIQQESGNKANAQSSAGAQGLMQLMPKTAKSLGVTNSFDPEQNIRGGSAYLDRLMTKYGGDATKALTAYNWGEGNLDAYIKTGKGKEGQPIPAEAKNYASSVLARLGVTSNVGNPLQEQRVQRSTDKNLLPLNSYVAKQGEGTFDIRPSEVDNFINGFKATKAQAKGNAETSLAQTIAKGNEVELGDNVSDASTFFGGSTRANIEALNTLYALPEYKQVAKSKSLSNAQLNNIVATAARRAGQSNLVYNRASTTDLKNNDYADYLRSGIKNALKANTDAKQLAINNEQNNYIMKALENPNWRGMTKPYLVRLLAESGALK